MKSYTICLIGLELRKTVVVGGGKVAIRKIHGLLSAGAKIRVISPKLSPELAVMAEAGAIEVVNRKYEEGDLEGAFLVIAATNDCVVNRQVWEESLRLGCLVNVVDDPQHSNFTLPAIVRRGEMNIAISTGGSSPALARRLRERLECMIEPEYESLTGIMAELRPELLASFPSAEARLLAALRIIDSDILNIIKKNGREAAMQYGRNQMQRESFIG